MLSLRSVVVVAALWSNVALGFAPPRFVVSTDASRLSTARFMSSYSTDASDYASKDSDYVSDDDDGLSSFGPGFQESDKFEVTELQPVPMSKNSGSRFVAIWWDRLFHPDKDVNFLHEERITHTEDHVFHCRKANLYNETFNTDSMVDVLWSRQILSSDLQRVIGQAICMESTELYHVKEFMAEEPLMKYMSGGDTSKIPLYRWRHLRDYTLRQDDGRFGTPCLLVCFDDDSNDEDEEEDEEEEEEEDIREETNMEHLEYLIRSERVIAAGPLHVATPTKEDPASVAVGDLIMFNAVDREAAIEFAEKTPRAQAGLYKSMQAHFYNNLDVTGKFCAWNLVDTESNESREMQEGLRMMGYPVEDHQTPWINW